MFCDKCGQEVRTIVTSAESVANSKVYRVRCFDCHAVLQIWTEKL